MFFCVFCVVFVPCGCICSQAAEGCFLCVFGYLFPAVTCCWPVVGGEWQNRMGGSAAPSQKKKRNGLCHLTIRISRIKGWNLNTLKCLQFLDLIAKARSCSWPLDQEITPGTVYTCTDDSPPPQSGHMVPSLNPIGFPSSLPISYHLYLSFYNPSPCPLCSKETWRPFWFQLVRSVDGI